MKLLIVDDEARIRALIAKYAAFEGYETEEAENGMQAVEKCRQRHYDLIIMDVMMPELDGFSAVREIRKTDPVPVIMLSARGEEYDRIHGFELGIDDYVVKPFSPKELMMRVGAVLKRSGEAEKKAEETVSVGGLTVDFTARRVLVDGVEAVRRRPDGGLYRPPGAGGRRGSGPEPEGIRSAFLHDPQPGHCPDAGKADQRCVGL